MVVDNPKAYGVILSRYWSAKLNRYFSTDWSHLWLPYKGQPRKIKVERENYMKHTITDLNDLNETVMFSRYVLGNFSFDTFFEEWEPKLSHTMNSNKQSELFHSNQIAKLNCTLVYLSNDASIGSSSCILVDSNHCTKITNHNLWTLYLYFQENIWSR